LRATGGALRHDFPLADGAVMTVILYVQYCCSY